MLGTAVRAYVRDRFGGPEVLTEAEIDRPEPGPGELLLRVRATSLNPYDWHHLRGEPLVARAMGVGLTRPAVTVLGADVAGEVVACGPGAGGFSPGDRVVALLEHGAFAQFASAPVERVVAAPRGTSFERAAALPLAACTALLALRDVGRLEPGRSVLVNGASGGVGTFAVQIARALGARVTGICSPANAELVRSLGAQAVLDRTARDPLAGVPPHDLVLDVAGGRPVWAYRDVVAPGGACVVVGGRPGRYLQPAGHVLAAAASGLLLPFRVAVADLTRHRAPGELLRAVVELVDVGAVRPVVDRCVPFGELPAALTYQESGAAPGKVVVVVD